MVAFFEVWVSHCLIKVSVLVTYSNKYSRRAYRVKPESCTVLCFGYGTCIVWVDPYKAWYSAIWYQRSNKVIVSYPWSNGTYRASVSIIMKPDFINFFVAENNKYKLPSIDLLQLMRLKPNWKHNQLNILVLCTLLILLWESPWSQTPVAMNLYKYFYISTLWSSKPCRTQSQAGLSVFMMNSCIINHK